MLFNSFEFIFVFLPLTLLLFNLARRFIGYDLALQWLVVASLAFYAWWSLLLLGLFLASIAVNAYLGFLLIARPAGAARRQAILTLGVVFNLALLGYFKYAGFIAGNLNALFASSLDPGDIVLPIAISFYTFQQIAFLVDAYRNQVKGFGFTRYVLFISFFPQLIAGPIIHHGEMMPQFATLGAKRFSLDDLAVGVSIFAVGLFKKAVLADISGHFADPLFAAAAQGTVLTFGESWVAALGFTFQIYFDFSGYSDMAIGIARMFGIVLPLNFHAPYKATSIIDFWRRWHMTLSRFLRDYLYFPLGGGRRGPVRRYVNLAVVMVLGGLWHGAAWTFVAWGALHGAYLIVNHAWRAVTRRRRQPAGRGTAGLARAITFLAVVFSWVLFRAQDLTSALDILQSMAGLNGISLGRNAAALFGEHAAGLKAYGIVFDGLFSNDIVPDRDFAIVWFIPLIVLVMAAPSTQDLFAGSAIAPAEGPPQRASRLQWTPGLAWSLATGAMIFLSLQQFFHATPFLYFQF